MIVIGVTFYGVVLFFHILAVVLAFGPTYAYPVFLAVAERTDPRAIPAVGRGIATWEKIGNAMLVVILAAGIYLVSDGPWSFGDFFIAWGFVYVIFIGAVSGGFFAPKTRQLVEICERDIAASSGGEVKLSAEFQALSGQIAKVGQLTGFLTILTIYVMTAKPFL